ncbi:MULTISPECIES: hypothetical protein [unclassified Pseudovibrio]|uniref:hypothetical protein n=1 Tax=unclassified Pseudovibrio TaxID=2627060 RepID=UPI0007B2A4C3|nr:MULTISPECIES: hypothetical protein [unclassified Pseudovibrio]KZL10673.1 hypothetical protein PsAD26_03037 [Pseudovibrio sp. Ad26]
METMTHGDCLRWAQKYRDMCLTHQEIHEQTGSAGSLSFARQYERLAKHWQAKADSFEQKEAA